MVATFIRLDGVGALMSLTLVVFVNLLAVDSALLWLVPAGLVVLLGALALAEVERRAGHLTAALAFITAGNWIVAILTPIALPFLWPVLILVVILPLVLAAPHLGVRSLFAMMSGACISVAAVALIGLTGDDRGAIPDIDDVLEVVVVVAFLAALTVPIIVVVWQANRLQRSALARSRRLNRELADTAQELSESRRRVVEAGDAARIQIERDLHDGAQQRLVSLGMRLRILEEQVGDDPQLHPSISAVVAELDASVEELRDLARGIYPPILEAQGLEEALVSVARRSPVQIEVSAGEIGRFSREVETAVYFAALEALANASKHAPGSSIRLSLGVNSLGTLTLTVTDDGPGFDLVEATKSRGILNMGDRIEAIDGDLRVVSAVGAGTSIVVVIPVAPRVVADEDH